MGAKDEFRAYNCLFQVESYYEPLGPLGKGSYGMVRYKAPYSRRGMHNKLFLPSGAMNTKINEKVAIKRIHPMSRRTNDAKHALREIRLLRGLGGHPNIVTLKDMMVRPEEDELYVVMDFVDTDLHKVIQSKQSLSESHHRYFLHQLLRGVKHMHDHGILHRDLKPGNLLIAKNCSLKVTDFGLARKIPDLESMNAGCRPSTAPAFRKKHRAPMTEHIITRWYRPPELMLQPDGYYDGAVDMWSIGCIFAEMLGRTPLFPGKNFVEQLGLIFDIIGTPNSNEISQIKSAKAQKFMQSMGPRPRKSFKSIFANASPEAIDLLENLLQFNPRKRFSVNEALRHPYMKSLEARYKFQDPEFPENIDFAFETSSKSCLRQTIIEEVDNFHHAINSIPELAKPILPLQKLPCNNAEHINVKPRPKTASRSTSVRTNGFKRPSTAKNMGISTKNQTNATTTQLETNFKSSGFRINLATAIKNSQITENASSSKNNSDCSAREKQVVPSSKIICMERPKTASIVIRSARPVSTHHVRGTRKVNQKIQLNSPQQDLPKTQEAPMLRPEMDESRPPAILPGPSGSAYALLREKKQDDRTEEDTPNYFQENKPFVHINARPRKSKPKISARKKPTVPHSPRFSVMSWQKKEVNDGKSSRRARRKGPSYVQ